MNDANGKSPPRERSSNSSTSPGAWRRRRKSTASSQPDEESEPAARAGSNPSSPTKLSSPPDSKLKVSKGPDHPIHHSQDSLFSSSSGYTNYRGFLNLGLILLVLSTSRVALENLIKYGILINPLVWFEYFWSKPYRYLPFLMLMASLAGYVWASLGLERRLATGKMTNKRGAILAMLICASALILPVVVSVSVAMDPFSSSFTLAIHTCVFLKLISYFQVNYWCRSSSSASNLHRSGSRQNGFSQHDVPPLLTGNSGAKKTPVKYPQNLTMGNLYYFLFAPTFCYELNFPRSPRIRKWFVLKRAVEVVFLAQIILGLCQQWLIPLLKNSVQPFVELDYGRMMERMLKLAIPNHAIWLIMFYWLFHSLLNLTAELLRFADREFYRDWWNSETVQYFWQAWNVPAHRWCVRHLYKPMVRNGFSKFHAAIAVFLVSAFFHEYLISVPLRLFRIWAFSGMLAQLPLNIITTKVLKGGKAGNMIVWLSLIVGQPLATLMYVHDYYVTHFGVPPPNN